MPRGREVDRRVAHGSTRAVGPLTRPGRQVCLDVRQRVTGRSGRRPKPRQVHLRGKEKDRHRASQLPSIARRLGRGFNRTSRKHDIAKQLVRSTRRHSTVSALHRERTRRTPNRAHQHSKHSQTKPRKPLHHPTPEYVSTTSSATQISIRPTAGAHVAGQCGPGEPAARKRASFATSPGNSSTCGSARSQGVAG